LKSRRAHELGLRALAHEAGCGECGSRVIDCLPVVSLAPERGGSIGYCVPFYCLRCGQAAAVTSSEGHLGPRIERELAEAWRDAVLITVGGSERA
jgi:hypothetical protein